MHFSTFIVVASCLIGYSMASWPDGVVSCPKMSNATAYNKCLNRLMKDVHPHLAGGIKEANIPKLDPYELANITVNRHIGPINVHAFATKIRVEGATNFQVQELRGDPNKLTLHLKVRMPLVRSSCDYDTRGSLLGIPITMKGHFQGSFTDSTVTADGTGKEVTDKKGIKRLKVKSLSIKVHVGGGKIKLDAKNQHQQVANVMQNLFNSSPRSFLDALTPIFEESAKDIILNLLNDALKTFTKDELILPK